jgi:hypothetical protein
MFGHEVVVRCNLLALAHHCLLHVPPQAFDTINIDHVFLSGHRNTWVGQTLWSPHVSSSKRTHRRTAFHGTLLFWPFVDWRFVGVRGRRGLLGIVLETRFLVVTLLSHNRYV